MWQQSKENQFSWQCKLKFLPFFFLVFPYFEVDNISYIIAFEMYTTPFPTVAYYSDWCAAVIVMHLQPRPPTHEITEAFLLANKWLEVFIHQRKSSILNKTLQWTLGQLLSLGLTGGRWYLIPGRHGQVNEGYAIPIKPGPTQEHRADWLTMVTAWKDDTLSTRYRPQIRLT